MGEMKWTTENPTEPGWYWVKHPFFNKIIAKIYKYVSQGFDDEKGTEILFVSESGPSKQLDSNFYRNCEWAGPISEPVESDD